MNNNKPAVVRVPGRAHPVTVHHSKVTELDDYGAWYAWRRKPNLPKTAANTIFLTFCCCSEDAVFRKTCKIHRQLPQGGILVFLTGKHEIIRMVNRLRRSLNKSDKNRESREMFHDQSVVDAAGNDLDSSTLRDMDDDEVDGDNFQTPEGPDDFDDAEQDETLASDVATTDNDDEDSPIPQKAVVLPLYSLLSTDEQAKVFAPVPEGYRLIVVATNIAETR